MASKPPDLQGAEFHVLIDYELCISAKEVYTLHTQLDSGILALDVQAFLHMSMYGEWSNFLLDLVYSSSKLELELEGFLCTVYSLILQIW